MKARLVLLVLWATMLSLTATAQEVVWTRVEVRVTAGAGDLIYLDAGTSQRVQPGDRVVLYPPRVASIEARIVSVTADSSRARIQVPGQVIAIGVRGEIFVPADRAASEGDAPDHPPWTHPEENWEEDRPLLAPAVALTPMERETRVRGRAFFQLEQTWDDENDNAKYFLGRTGVDMSWENPFARGGAIDLDVELFHRRADLSDEANDDDTRLRVDRLSYRLGGYRGAPRRIELGRFLHHEFPELGVVDGVEVGIRTEAGHRFGGSIGFLPEPFAEFDTGEDLQTSIFYRHVIGDEEELALGTAYQKSWHNGAADRDLFLFTTEYFPDRDVSIFGSAWVDYYTGNDDPKSAGVELTEFHFNGTWRLSDRSGVGAYANHFRYPQIERDEFTPLPDSQIDNNRVSRTGVRGWRDFSDSVRGDARVDYWKDEDDSGGGAEASIGLRDVVLPRGELTLAAFVDEGEFTDTTGLRLGANQRFDRSSWRLFYEIADFDQTGFNGVDVGLVQHRFRATWDTDLGSRWNLSLSAEGRFGDEQDSRTVGFFLQRRF